MNTSLRRFVPIFVTFLVFWLASAARGNQKGADQNAAAHDDHPTSVVVSGVATTAHIAGPSEPVVVNGVVMKMADFAAVVSSNIEAVQRLRSQETRSHEPDQPAPQSHPSR
jgi:hypothetical protein